MSTSRIPATVATGLALALPVLLAGCNPGTASKAGGDLPAITLTIGNEETSGRVSGDVMDEFARQVAQHSDGSVTIDVVYQAAGENQADFDQKVARMVVAGDLDLGLIPSRAWDTEGVPSLRALQAPLLVDSDPLLDAVVADPVADEMLAGLAGSGVTGLALVPEGLRHLFSFDRPIRTPADLRGLVVRTPRSEISYRVFEAVGAEATDAAGPGRDFQTEVTDGSLDVVETTFRGGTDLPRDAMVAANLTVYPKVFTVVVNDESLAGLSDDQQEALREAALATRDWAVGELPDDAEGLEIFCGYGLRGVVASPADLRRWDDAMRPVYAELEADRLTREAIARIRELKDGVPVEPPVGCAAGRTTGDEEPNAGAVGPFPDGIYRRAVSLEMMLAAGADETAAADYVGLHTLTFDSGSVMVEQQGYDPCEASYQSTKTDLAWQFGPDCGNGRLDATWVVRGDKLVFSEVSDPTSPVGSALISGVLTGSWRRIG